MVLFALISCSSEKPADMQAKKEAGTGEGAVSETAQTPSGAAGAYSIEITPKDANRSSVITLTPKGFNIADAKVEWTINGYKVAAANPSQLNAMETRKGDRVQAKAAVKGTEILSNTLQISNAPPEITSVKLTPEFFKPGDTIGVEASAKDIDGDDVTIFYEWTKNNEPAGKGRQIGATVKRGDKISVKITPFDGEVYGKPVVLEREIQNMPPVISDDRRFNFDGKTFAYQVRATDPDGDPLTFSLKSGPAGMTIDSRTGMIQWSVPQDFKGKATFTVSVNDGHGGEAVYNIKVSIGDADKK